jgi:hypothetical protein
MQQRVFAVDPASGDRATGDDLDAAPGVVGAVAVGSERPPEVRLGECHHALRDAELLHRIVEALDPVADRREQSRLIFVLAVVGVEPAHRDEKDHHGIPSSLPAMSLAAVAVRRGPEAVAADCPEARGSGPPFCRTSPELEALLHRGEARSYMVCDRCPLERREVGASPGAETQEGVGPAAPSYRHGDAPAVQRLARGGRWRDPVRA